MIIYKALVRKKHAVSSNKTKEKQTIPFYQRRERELEPFEQLFKEHFRTVYHFVYYMIGNKADAEDVTQEVFMKIAQHYDSFRGESTLTTWIYSIARRTVIDYTRQKKTKKFLSFWKNHIPEDYEASDGIDSPGEMIVKKEEEESVHGLIKQLPEKMQAVIYLRYIKGLSLQETAGILDMTTNQVSVTQNRALSKLRNTIETESMLKEGIK